MAEFAVISRPKKGATKVWTVNLITKKSKIYVLIGKIILAMMITYAHISIVYLPLSPNKISTPIKISFHHLIKIFNP